MIKYRSKEIYGDLYENGQNPLVVLINGSKPGIPDPINEEFLNSLRKSYNVLLLAYYGVGQLNETLENIPMEYFINAIDFIKNKIGITNDKIAIVGNSKGGEAALVLTKYCKSKATVACVASSYVFAGLPKDYRDMINNPKSSWTYKNKELPYIKFYIDDKILKDAMNNKFINCHEKSIELNYKKDAEINIDNYNGNILLLSAENDPYWPSKKMSKKLFDNCKDKSKVYHITLNLNGHRYLDFPESTKEILRFLKNSL